jgi:A/G-specific adenine glycosylase
MYALLLKNDFFFYKIFHFSCQPLIMLQQKLQNWYQIHRRNLPWRHTTDAYTIWLSEIILQQTRVNQGLPYFEKFYKNYPKVTDLANAPQDEVLKLWQGLGYYSRGRNMHFTAQWVVKNYKSRSIY